MKNPVKPGPHRIEVDCPMTSPPLARPGQLRSDVFAAGGDGTILHYDGASWTSMKTARFGPGRIVGSSTASGSRWGGGHHSPL